MVLHPGRLGVSIGLMAETARRFGRDPMRRSRRGSEILSPDSRIGVRPSCLEVRAVVTSKGADVIVAMEPPAPGRLLKGEMDTSHLLHIPRRHQIRGKQLAVDTRSPP